MSRIQTDSKKSVFIGLFGKKLGKKLFNWLDPCCDHFCEDVLECIADTGGAGGGMFYGLTAGTGNPTTTDYAATVAVKTSVGTGRVPFPRDGANFAASGGVRIDGSSFTLSEIGFYEIIFNVHTTEPGQLQIEIDGLGVPETTTPNQNPTSGGHPINGHSIIETTIVDSVLAIINPPGNSPALTITPADGASTHANAQRLIIRKI